MHAKQSVSLVSALLGCLLLCTSQAQTEPDKTDVQTLPDTPWPVEVVTTPEAKACVTALMEEEADKNAVSSAAGETFVGCMKVAHAENFYEFDRFKANGAILLKKPDPCLRVAKAGGAICVVLPTQSADPLKGTIVVTSSKAARLLTLAIDPAGHSRPPCQNAYGDACGTKYSRAASDHGNTD